MLTQIFQTNTEETMARNKPVQSHCYATKKLQTNLELAKDANLRLQDVARDLGAMKTGAGQYTCLIEFWA